eukprot:m.181149 g.181149  ORF g.181149 m.181149 type:complete len:94 (+) comp16869_c0_seq8:3956-4237(+)
MRMKLGSLQHTHTWYGLSLTAVLVVQPLADISAVIWLDHRCYEAGCIRLAMSASTKDMKTPFRHRGLDEVSSTYSIGRTLAVQEDVQEEEDGS